MASLALMLRRCDVMTCPGEVQCNVMACPVPLPACRYEIQLAAADKQYQTLQRQYESLVNSQDKMVEVGGGGGGAGQ